MADPKSIHEFLPTSGNIGSLFLVDDPDSQATSGYTTRQISMDDVGEMVNNGIDYTQDLSTENKKVIGAINELHGVDGYDVYDNTAIYAVGDICIHSNSLQVCTTAVTVAEDFDSSKWSPTSLKALLALKQNSNDNSLTTTNKQIVPAINEVVSGKADFSDISATVSFGSDISASGSFKWVVKIGKLVYIYANLQPKENWTGGNKILLSGLPVRAEYQESNYIPYTVGTQYYNSENNTIRGAAVNGSNQLQTQNSSNITTTNRIYINGFYRCQ